MRLLGYSELFLFRRGNELGKDLQIVRVERVFKVI